MKPNNVQNEYPNAFYLFFLLPIIALIAPVVLIPIEKIFPYPCIIEEIVKVIFVLFILCLPSKNFQIKLAIFIAFLFAFSENFFYLSNFVTSENTSLFFQRFVLTGALHISTVLIILIPAQKYRPLIFPAAILAIFVHYIYNQNIYLLFR